MNTLKDYVNWKLTHADKVAEAEGYPMVMENCKANKQMKQLEIYGNSFQDGTPTPENSVEVQSVGELVSDENDVNFGKYKVPILIKANNEIATHNIFLVEPLYKIGDSADYIDFKNSKVIRKVKAQSILTTATISKNSYYSGLGWERCRLPLQAHRRDPVRQDQVRVRSCCR